MTAPEQQLVFHRIARGHYLLSETETPVELRMSGWRSRGEAIIGRNSYVLQRTGFFDRGVAVIGPSGAQILRLGRRSTLIPPLGDCTWKIRSRLRGYEANLGSREVGSMTFRVGYGGRADISAQVVGDWPQRDLIAVAGAFAVLLRRREDSEAGAGVAASTAAIS
jgi:hypothetical protein